MTTTSSPSPATEEMLALLRQVASQTLERKRRLGEYVVLWQHGSPVLVGEDAPSMEWQTTPPPHQN